MTMHHDGPYSYSVTTGFNDSSAPPEPSDDAPKPKRPSPISVRFSEEERIELVSRAAGRPISRYIRDRALGKREKRPLGPGLSESNLARILSLLGQSGIAVHLEEIAEAAKIGAFDAAPETLTAIRQACLDVADIRRMLLAALGLQVS